MSILPGTSWDLFPVVVRVFCAIAGCLDVEDGRGIFDEAVHCTVYPFSALLVPLSLKSL